MAADRLAARIVAELEEVAEAECVLVSEIGRPVDQPKLIGVSLRGAGQEAAVKAIVEEVLAEIPTLWREIIAGGVTLY